MNAYYIRCRAADVPQLLALGVLLGVLAEAEGAHVAAEPGIVWDVIGPVHEPTGETGEDGQPLSAPVCDADGVPYWHANLHTPFALLERAQQLAAEHPEIAEALGAIPRWFLVDAEGRARAPASPARVLFGMEPTLNINTETRP
jgi:hypothetical protein